MPEFLHCNGRVHHVRHRPGNGGPAIVFANSLGTDFRIWDDVIAGLPEDQPVLLADKSGHGLSEGGAASIGDLADDVAAIMDAHSVSSALICGVSVGGMIAQSLAAKRPDLVAALLLSNTSYRIGNDEMWNSRIAQVEEHGLASISGQVIERWFSERYRTDRPFETAGYQSMLARTPSEGYRTVCAAIRDTNLIETTRQITCPTLCVAGSDDLSTPPEIVKALADAIPGSEYTCIEGVGHLPCIEAPDVISRSLMALLERVER